MAYKRYSDILSVTNTASLYLRGRNDSSNITVENNGLYVWESTGSADGLTILTASGSGVWRKIFSQGTGSGGTVTSASNGLTISGNTINLGGILNGDTVIDANYNNFAISNLNEQSTASVLYYDYNTGYITYQTPAVVMTTGLNGLYSPGIGATENDGGIVLGNNAGFSSSNAQGDIFLGTFAGSYASSSAGSIMFGFQSGIRSRKSAYAIMLGYQSGFSASISDYIVNIGYQAGFRISSSAYSVTIGYQAGYRTTGSANTIMIGNGAGLNSRNLAESVVLGTTAGINAYGNDGLVLIGRAAGSNLISSSNNIMIGDGSGGASYYITSSIFLGLNSGLSSYASNNIIAIGYYAGSDLGESSDVIYLGTRSGLISYNNTSSIFIGTDAGSNSYSNTGSIFIGDRAGYGITSGSNGIFIGNNVGNEQFKVVEGYPPTNNAQYNYSVLLGKFLRTGGKKNSVLIGGNTGSNVFISNSMDNQFMLSPNILNAQFRSVDYVFPSAQGAAGTILVNDGAGGLSWIATSGSVSASYEGFVATSSFNPFTASINSFTASINTIPSNRLLFISGGAVTSSATLYWDATGSRLGINVGTAPVSKLHIISNDFDKITVDDTSNSGVTQMRMKASGQSLTFGIAGSTYSSAGAFQASGSYLSSNGRKGLNLIASDTRGDVLIYTGGSGDANLRMSVSASGLIILNSLTGSGTRNLVINDSGSLSAITLQNALITSSAASSATSSISLTPTGSAAFFDYSVISGSNMRAGSIMSISDGTVVNWTETSTIDIGSTSTLTFLMNVTGSNYDLRVLNKSGGSYSVKVLKRII